MELMNKDLRRKITDMVVNGRDGHIPSAFCIVDIIEYLFRNVLKYNPQNPEWEERDYFILSKGHGCLAFYTVLEKYGFISQREINTFCTAQG